jgi:hypothetical protein
MRFVAVRSEESQAAAVIFRIRDLLVSQRTQLINAALTVIWASLGWWSRGGGLGGRVGCNRGWLGDVTSGGNTTGSASLGLCPDPYEGRDPELEAEIVRRARENEVACRLITIPGVGPLIATRLVALAPPLRITRGSATHPMDLYHARPRRRPCAWLMRTAEVPVCDLGRLLEVVLDPGDVLQDRGCGVPVGEVDMDLAHLAA